MNSVIYLGRAWCKVGSFFNHVKLARIQRGRVVVTFADEMDVEWEPTKFNVFLAKIAGVLFG